MTRARTAGRTGQAGPQRSRATTAVGARAAGLIGTLTVLALAAAGCTPAGPGSAGPPAAAATSTVTSTARPGPGGPTAGATPPPAPWPNVPVDRRDPDAVAVAALTALYSYDTTLDRRPADAAQRARSWLSGSFSTAIATLPPLAGPGATWSTWTAHRAVVHATVTPGDDPRPADHATRAHRQLLVTLTPRGRDGWRGPLRRITVFVVLDRTATGWAVSTILPR